MSDQTARKIFGTPEEWRQGSFAEVKHGVIDVAIGGGLFGIISGAAVGPLYQVTKELGAANIMGVIGAIIGAIGGALIGTIVGGVGELICSKFGLDKYLRENLRGRLDGVRGRLLYGGLLGAIGGPVIMVIVRAIYDGFSGIIDALFIGVVFWGFWGVIGGGVDWLFNWGIQTDRRLGGTTIGGGIGIIIGMVYGAIVWVSSGGLIGALIGAILLIVIGAGVGLVAKIYWHK